MPTVQSRYVAARPSRRLRIPVFPLLLLMLSPGMRAEAQIWYVSPTGDNANPGTLTQPFASPGYATARMLGGDTLVILSGTYPCAVYEDLLNVKNGSAEHWTVVRGQGPTRPILLGTGRPENTFTAVSLIQDPKETPIQYIRIENLEITNSRAKPYRPGFTNGIDAAEEFYYIHSHDLQFVDLHIHHIDNTAISLPRNVDRVLIQRDSLHHTTGDIIASAHAAPDSEALIHPTGLRNILVDHCYLGYSGHFDPKTGDETVDPDPSNRPDAFGIELSDGPVELAYTTSEHNRGDGLDSKSNGTYVHHCRVQNNYGDGVRRIRPSISSM